MERYAASSCDSEDVSGYEIRRKFSESLNISRHEEEGDGDDDDFDNDDEDLTAEILAQNGYGKSIGDKYSNVENQDYGCDDDEEEEEEDEEDLTAAILAQSGYLKDETFKHSPSVWPSDKKLVSAFKGSREKEGLVDTKGRVMWAPDVYDPPPTSEDHLAQNKTERHRSESKKPKNKQKWGGKGAGEGKEKGKGKDKKQQVQKHGSGSSSKGIKKLEDYESLVGSTPSTASEHSVKAKNERPSKSNSKSEKGKGKDNKQVQKCKTVDNDDGLADSIAPYAEFQDRY